jgi:NADH-quinone oxidoreductase subunit N
MTGMTVSLAEQIANLHRVAPEVVLCLFGMIIMIVDPFLKPSSRRALGWIAFVGTLVALASIHVAASEKGFAYSRLISTDSFSIFVHVIVIGAAALAILGSLDYLDREGIQRGEFYALILFATAGMGILASANELITAFIGLEISSISTYILCGFRRQVKESNEAAMKYFLLGSFATAFFLYGIAMIYGSTGTTFIDGAKSELERQLAANGHIPSLALLGLGLIFVGLGFKVVAAPFQIYAPDVYEGAPAPVTALLASAPKAATFALMIRIFYVSFHSASNTWFWVIWISAVLTMFIGNLGALVQTNVKRMLAYSSIAHAGYILVAFAASTELGVAAVLFYLAAYVLMKVGAFLVVTHVGQQGEKRLAIQDYAGLGMKQPALAACFSLFLLALLGLPATGGFLGKFFAFQGALDSARSHGGAVIVLVVIAAINSVIGAYYYVRVIVAMYFWPQSQEYVPTRVAPAMVFALFVAAIGTLYLGIVPGRIHSLAESAAHSLPVQSPGSNAPSNASLAAPSDGNAVR